MHAYSSVSMDEKEVFLHQAFAEHPEIQENNNSLSLSLRIITSAIKLIHRFMENDSMIFSDITLLPH